ncbi:DNA alkylation repair protein [Bacillus sp. REN10]|uniref:DNA alkylation repair protein n=1 Tax=Bacillus sp. REN10 TaxID=2782541 RepID=UPI00193BE6D4|nr:DNA alkylation repair protein [Bacillus sp. REN10]
MDLSYIQPLITHMQAQENKERAEKMAAYMKDHFSFLGIPAPERTAIFREFLKEYGKPTMEELPETVRTLWVMPEREYQYCALAFLEKALRQLTPEHLPLLEDIALSKSWWDTIDLIASKLMGQILMKYPDERAVWVSRWDQSDNMWLNRIAILFQLKYKEKTDVHLLKSIILHHSEQKEFFIQKAIGWALREYAKTNPSFVLQFVEQHSLPSLSKREAVKNLLK